MQLVPRVMTLDTSGSVLIAKFEGLFRLNGHWCFGQLFDFRVKLLLHGHLARLRLDLLFVHQLRLLLLPSSL